MNTPLVIVKRPFEKEKGDMARKQRKLVRDVFAPTTTEAGAAPKRKPAPREKKQVADYPHLVTLSLVMYRAENERLEELVEHAKLKAIAEGRKPPSKSDLVRAALKKLSKKDVEKL